MKYSKWNCQLPPTQKNSFPLMNIYISTMFVDSHHLFSMKYILVMDKKLNIKPTMISSDFIELTHNGRNCHEIIFTSRKKGKVQILRIGAVFQMRLIIRIKKNITHAE